VPGDWGQGFVWARRDCNFEKSPNPNSCLDGGCPGGVLLCESLPGAPVTIAEFSLSLDPNEPDSYAISLVHGYNLPMIIENDTGCGVPKCSVNLGKCPVSLRGPVNSSGFTVGCNSACDADIAPDPGNDPNCCTGIHDSAATCPSSGVQSYSYFKNSCPNAIVYTFDESGQSVFSCSSAFQAGYTVTFCP